MAKTSVKGSGTKQSPWQLTTPSGSSEYQMYKDESLDPPAIVCIVGKTELRYHARAIEDLHTMLKKHGDWMPLGSADERKPAAAGTVEARGRSPKNPVGGWYGLKKGLRGRFGMYMPPLLEALGAPRPRRGDPKGRACSSSDRLDFQNVSPCHDLVYGRTPGDGRNKSGLLAT